MHGVDHEFNRLGERWNSTCAYRNTHFAFDVFDQEPLRPDHRIWTMPNVLVTPHVAMVGPDIDRRRYELIADNCRRLLTGEPLQYVVTDKILGF